MLSVAERTNVIRLIISRIPSASVSFSLALSFGKRYHTVRMVAFMVKYPPPEEDGLVRTLARHGSPNEGNCETSLGKVKGVFPLAV